MPQAKPGSADDVSPSFSLDISRSERRFCGSKRAESELTSMHASEKFRAKLY